MPTPTEALSAPTELLSLSFTSQGLPGWLQPLHPSLFILLPAGLRPRAQRGPAPARRFSTTDSGSGAVRRRRSRRGSPVPAKIPRFWTRGAQPSPCPEEAHLEPRSSGCPPLSPPLPRVFSCCLLHPGATQLLPGHTSILITQPAVAEGHGSALHAGLCSPAPLTLHETLEAAHLFLVLC